ncbi:light-harvesting complex-like protein OHP1, chloroplastic [Mangifera indica]|uniref:light-harvesting complex-like protein OHP1, chloroplastic n=1 Tax=Mangifera indica TaxID=29780 RepID=UPI001CFBA41C|nr:light-harvesting complex-like protein OHP1, chloroplastic [Mangifera indica]
MATSSLISSSLLPTKPLQIHRQNHQLSPFTNRNRVDTASNKAPSFRIRAAKPPAGVEFPKVQPKFQAPFLGFTRTAEIWNSRACMIGLIGTFIVELILNKGILQVIGVDVGKGLNLPL